MYMYRQRFNWLAWKDLLSCSRYTWAVACKHHMRSQILRVIVTGPHEHGISASGCQKVHFTCHLIICGFLARDQLVATSRRTSGFLLYTHFCGDLCL